jgi:hypothetical protein
MLGRRRSRRRRRAYLVWATCYSKYSCQLLSLLAIISLELLHHPRLNLDRAFRARRRPRARLLDVLNRSSTGHGPDLSTVRDVRLSSIRRTFT